MFVEVSRIDPCSVEKTLFMKQKSHGVCFFPGCTARMPDLDERIGFQQWNNMFADRLVKLGIAKHFGHADGHNLEKFVEALFIMEQAIQQFAKVCQPGQRQRPLQAAPEGGPRVMREVVPVAGTYTMQQHLDFYFFTVNWAHKDSTMVRLILPLPVGTTTLVTR